MSAGANKVLSFQVVHNLGLCISLWDIQKLEDSYIFPGDGSHHTVGMFVYIIYKLCLSRFQRKCHGIAVTTFSASTSSALWSLALACKNCKIL